MDLATSQSGLILDIVDHLVAGYQPERIILFGSYAYGEATLDSDIDLLIVKETDERPIDRRVRVREVVYQPWGRIAISPLVVTPAELNERLASGDDFLRDVITRGKILYERD